MSDRNSYSPGLFCWIDLATHDRQAAIAFYNELLGWTNSGTGAAEEAPYSIWSYGDDAVGGVWQIEDEMDEPTWLSYIAVEDAAATAEQVLTLGGSLHRVVTDVGDPGIMAAFRDPEGALFAVWQAKGHIGATRGGEPISPAWFELSCHDMTAAKAFYGALFGWDFSTVDTPAGQYTIIDAAGEAAGAIIELPSEFAEHPAEWSIYFSVDDVAGTANRLEALGGELLLPLVDTPSGPMGIAADPSGVTFSLISPDEPEE